MRRVRKDGYDEVRKPQTFVYTPEILPPIDSILSYNYMKIHNENVSVQHVLPLGRGERIAAVVNNNVHVYEFEEYKRPLSILHRFVDYTDEYILYYGSSGTTALALGDGSITMGTLNGVLDNLLPKCRQRIRMKDSDNPLSALATDDTMIASAYGSSGIFLWNAKLGGIFARLQTNKHHFILDIAIGQGAIVTASAKGEIRLYVGDRNGAFAFTRRINGLHGNASRPIRSIIWIDNHTIVSGGDDGVIVGLDLLTMKVVARVQAGVGAINDLQLHVIGKSKIFVSGKKGSIYFDILCRASVANEDQTKENPGG